jgi:hypothetical protein
MRVFWFRRSAARWTADDQGYDFYFRQLRDMRMKIDVESMPKQDWFEYVGLCGWLPEEKLYRLMKR